MGKDNSSAAFARSRSNVYGFLARVYREEPDDELISSVGSGPLRDLFVELGVNSHIASLNSSPESLTEELAVEFARLFLGPGHHISPHESVHHEREDGKSGVLWGASTAEVKKFYEASGLKLNDDSPLIPDHISVELEFMQSAAEREAQAHDEGDAEGVNYCLGMEKQFLEKHLAQWTATFCHKVIAESEAPFYREIAELTRGFVDFDTKFVREGVGE